MAKLIVIADDFTGANDTGAQLAKKGAYVNVGFSDEPINCDVTVINTDSRSLNSELAAEKVIHGIQQHLSDPIQIIFKKIDSTFRGNIGAELDAVYRTFTSSLIVVAAAIPSTGRTTLNGECLVNGIPLIETEFAQDPKTPIHSSKIAEIISLQSKLPCQTVTIDALRNQKLKSIFKTELNASERSVIIIDSETENDLRLIAQELSTIEQPIILVGAAGIASQLPSSMFLSKENKPVLVLSGSMSVTTQEQIDYCVAQGIDVLNLDVQKIYLEPEQSLQNATKTVSDTLLLGKDCIVRTVTNQTERERSKDFCQHHQITGTEMGDKVAQFLGLLASQIIDTTPLAGALFTGGDIAIAAANALNAQGYIIKGEVEPCIPYGEFTNNKLPIVTKAGGFGDINSINNVIRFLKETSL